MRPRVAPQLKAVGRHAPRRPHQCNVMRVARSVLAVNCIIAWMNSLHARRCLNMTQLWSDIVRDQAWCVWFAGHPLLRKAYEIIFGLNQIRIN
jgi:hypothetical protein